MGSVSSAFERPAAAIGEAVCYGKAELKGRGGKWMPVVGKTFPVVDGVSLRSGEGSAAVTMRDRVRMEMGWNSELTVYGRSGSYSLMLARGSLGFSVPEGVFFSVATPTSVVQVPAGGPIQKVNHAAPDSVRGMVVFDGKETKVVSLSGDLMVKDLSGAGQQLLSAGDSLYLSAHETGAVAPLRLIGGGQNRDDRSNDSDPLLTGLIMTGGTIGAFLIVDSFYNEGGGHPASPFVP